MVDIWASAEEIEYEQNMCGGGGGKSPMLAMEGIADQKPPDDPYLPRWKRKKETFAAKKSNKEITVIDDPCCPNADGYGEYRDRDQIERQVKEVTILKQQQHEHAAKQMAKISSTYEQHIAQLSSLPSQPPPMPTYHVQQPIWYYRDNTSGMIQGPFSGEQMIGWRTFFPVFTPVRFGHAVDGKFLPLSEIDFLNTPFTPVPPRPPPQVMEEEDIVAPAGKPSDYLSNSQYYERELVETSMQPKSFESEVALSRPQVGLFIPPPSDDAEENGSDMCIPSPSDYDEVDLCIPPPSDDEEDDDNDVYNKHDGHELDDCVPPPSDGVEGDDFEIPYPTTSEYVYPVDKELSYPTDLEYPVDDAYGYLDTGGAYYSPGEMAAVVPYPVAGDVAFGVADDLDIRTKVHGVMPPVEEKKKKYMGDKAVVGFVPSHLRVKRKVAKPKKSSALTPKTSEPAQGYSVADDYNKFMDEITKLT